MSERGTGQTHSYVTLGAWPHDDPWPVGTRKQMVIVLAGRRHEVAFVVVGDGNRDGWRQSMRALSGWDDVRIAENELTIAEGSRFYRVLMD